MPKPSFNILHQCSYTEETVDSKLLVVSSCENSVSTTITHKPKKMNKKGNKCSQGTNTSSEKSIRTRQNDATWDHASTTILLEIMYGMYVAGNLLSSTFSDTIWADIGKELHERTQKIYTIDQLKGKACRMRILWRKFHDLIAKKTGFGWDPLTGTVTASDECWDSWIADNPGEAKLRCRGLPHYPYCTEMFGSSVATGDLAKSSTMSTWDSNEEDGLNNSYPVSSRRVDGNGGSPLPTVTSGCVNGIGESHLPNERVVLETNIDGLPESSSQHTSKETKSTKSNRSSRIDYALDAWTSVNSARARKLQKQSTHSVENCMVALRKIEGLPRRLFFLAQDSFLSKTRRKMFLLMTEEEQKDWVESLNG